MGHSAPTASGPTDVPGRAPLGPVGPVGLAAEEELVRNSLKLALHVRAHSWAAADLGPLGVRGRSDVQQLDVRHLGERPSGAQHSGDQYSGVQHSGEVQMADAIDVLGRLMLPNAAPAGWAATLVTDLARGDKTLEAGVKLGKYAFHPTFLALADDASRIVGEAVHHIHVHRLHELVDVVRDCVGIAQHPAPEVELTSAADLATKGLEPPAPSITPSRVRRGPGRRRRVTGRKGGRAPDPVHLDELDWTAWELDTSGVRNVSEPVSVAEETPFDFGI
ncbi:hypothetical protein N4G70_13645 [Streptomyces sp. ASQP_92]|uniref:hypothetical protein n=1 Tax=Streptomyces sp. ASQP_92 TaxID=2979116 RepID=UPI0021C22C3A|nr:hypothetical protein [Streptomyces sp. ASQP_92]MCT9089907.1 hypothetical protein [Streptomyces sp. ASQP_92]